MGDTHRTADRQPDLDMDYVMNDGGYFGYHNHR